MEPLVIIVVGVFIIVGLSYYVGRLNKELETKEEELTKNSEIFNESNEISKRIDNSNPDAIRNELRKDLRK